MTGTARQADTEQRGAINDAIATLAFDGAVGPGQRGEIEVGGQQG